MYRDPGFPPVLHPRKTSPHLSDLVLSAVQGYVHVVLGVLRSLPLAGEVPGREPEHDPIVIWLADRGARGWSEVTNPKDLRVSVKRCHKVYIDSLQIVVNVVMEFGRVGR